MRRSLAAGPFAASGHALMRQRMLRKTRGSLIVAAFVCPMVLVKLQQHICFSGFKTSFQPRFNALSRPHGSRCGQFALGALSSGDDLQVKFQGRWVDAVVDAQLKEGIKVHFAMDGYEYHLLASTWRTGVLDETSQMLESPSKSTVLDEFRNLSANDWMDAKVDAELPSGLFVTVSHPWNNRSARAFVPRGHFKQSPQLTKNAQVRVRVANVDVKKGKTMEVSMLPEIVSSDFDEFRNLSANDWMDAKVDAEVPSGLFVTVSHPWNNRSASAFVPRGHFKPSPQLTKNAQVRVRVANVDVEKGKRMEVSMLPESVSSDFARIPQDLWLNGTITGIRESGLLVLVEPPVGSIGGPRTGLVMRQNALDSIGGPRVGLALHQNAVVDNAEASDGAAAEKDLWSAFNVGGEVQVRVRKITSKGALFLSMRESLGTTDMLEAIVTNVTSR